MQRPSGRMQRPSGRQPNQLRNITIKRRFTHHAEGSVLVSFGHTQVICTASVEASVPPFLKGKGQGWLTAEYGMLPRSTDTRMSREAARGKQGGRTVEIQRLIGRSLRAAVDLNALGEHTIIIDCDVIQADGSTRTAAITGGCVALADALHHMQTHQLIAQNPLKQMIAAVSVGIYKDEPILDLDYAEDHHAQTDMNVVMNESGHFIEIQGTAESAAYSQTEVDCMLTLAQSGIDQLINKQTASLAEPSQAHIRQDLEPSGF